MGQTCGHRSGEETQTWESTPGTEKRPLGLAEGRQQERSESRDDRVGDRDRLVRDSGSGDSRRPMQCTASERREVSVSLSRRGV